MKNEPATSNQQPATSNQQPATSNQQPAKIWRIALRLLTIFFFISFPFSCKKDNLTQPNSNAIQSYLLNDVEKDFFSLEGRLPNDLIESRTSVVAFNHHPMVLKAYDQIFKQNQDARFVTDLYLKIGLPNWEKSLVRVDEGVGVSQVIIPFHHRNGDQTEALLVLSKNLAEDFFSILPISRKVILETDLNAIQMLQYARTIRDYDNLLFGNVKDDIKNAICRIKDSVGTNPLSTIGTSPLPTNPTGPCEWRYIEVCEGPTGWWYGGIANMPPHFDHDFDGIVNWLDQDFAQLTQSYGYDPSYMQSRIEQEMRAYWISAGYEAQYGDYDSFWADFDVDLDYEGAQDFQDNWDDEHQSFGEPNDPDDNFNNDDGIPCPDIDPPFSGQSGDRSPCLWYSVYDCGTMDDPNGEPYEWWHTFTTWNPCPECPDLFEQAFQHYILPYIEHDQTRVEEEKEYWLSVIAACDPLSPGFEDCIGESWWNDWLPAPPPPGDQININTAVWDCLFPYAPGQTYKVTLYLEQPVPTQRVTHYVNNIGPQVGHAFLGISQYNSNGELIANTNIGWYPRQEVGQSNTTVIGGFCNQATGTEYNISVAWDVTFNDLQGIIQSLSQHTIYDLLNNNCTSVLVEALNTVPTIGGLWPLPHTIRQIPNWNHNPLQYYVLDYNPGDLGEDLRANPFGGVFNSFASPYPIAPLKKCK